MTQRIFQAILVKPSHYDDDGYVIQWRRSLVPSNSLASIYGLIRDCAEQQLLGPDMRIEVEAYDECNRWIDTRKLARMVKAADAGFVGLVGVQSNQFPRAMDLARLLRKEDVPVIIGGFHVSGCLAMLPIIPPELQQALDLGVTIFAGEAETRMTDLLRDVASGRLKPVYNFLSDLPALEGSPLPFLPRKISSRVAGTYTSFDAGRGCPFQCSFCTIINVQGRKSRTRTADEVEAIVRANLAEGISRFFVTDDNFARNKNWEAIFRRLARMREVEGLKIRLIIQVDTLCHRIPGFVELAARAGCHSVFIGLENINPASLMDAKKRQNKIWEYREMLLAWRKVNAMTYAGYILGFPTDTAESIARDIETIKEQLPIDILEFFCLTPLPGSEDHKKLDARGVEMDADLNKYDLEHACTAHPRMSKQEWIETYDRAWAQYYSDDHVEKIMRRAAVSGIKDTKILQWVTIFAGACRIERVHPLQFGFLRRKVRTDRRYGMPLVHPLLFYPWRCFDLLRSASQWLQLVLRYKRIQRRVKADPLRMSYTDASLREFTSAAADPFVQEFADRLPATYGAPRPARVG